MKILKKVVIIMFLFILFSVNISNADESPKTFDIWGVGKEFINLGIEENDGNTKINPAAKTQFEYVLDFLWGLGLLTILISTIVLGAKYMLVSPGEKSKIKQATYPYAIGVIIIFGATTIWKLLIDILDGSL